MQELSTRERRHARTRDAILEAARALIAEQGVEGFSLREIARRIDYSPAGLYDYFGSKEEIVSALCDEGFRRLTIELRSVDQALPPLDALAETGIRYLRFARANPDFFLLMFTSGPISNLYKLPGEISLNETLQRSPAFLVLFDAVGKCVLTARFQERAGRSQFDIAIMHWQLIHGISMLGITMAQAHPDYETNARTALRILALGLQAE